MQQKQHVRLTAACSTSDTVEQQAYSLPRQSSRCGQDALVSEGAAALQQQAGKALQGQPDHLAANLAASNIRVLPSISRSCNVQKP